MSQLGSGLIKSVNSARVKKVDPAMKTPKSVVDTTVEAFEDVRSAFLPCLIQVT